VDLTEFLFFNLFENEPIIPITLFGHLAIILFLYSG
jgi:hypothetical protein